MIKEVKFAAFSSAVTGSCATGLSGAVVRTDANCVTSVNALGLVQAACLYNNTCTLLASRSKFSFQQPPSECTAFSPVLALNVSCSPAPSPATPMLLSAVPVPVCGGAIDGESMKLSCAHLPSGYLITNIRFASYGRPFGSCQTNSSSSSAALAFQPSTCDSINAMAVVQATCLNKPSCALAVRPTAFSKFAVGYQGMLTSSYCGSNDPLRWLFVQAACSQPASPTGAFFYSAVRSASISSPTATVKLACPFTGMVVSKIDLVAYGEPMGHFLTDYSNFTSAAPPPQTLFSSLFSSYWNGGWANCDCSSPPKNVAQQPCSQSGLALLTAKCTMQTNCTVPLSLLSLLPTTASAVECANSAFSYAGPMVYVQGNCFGCPAGSYFNSPGRSLSCSACAVGSYSNGIGSKRCRAAPLGAQATSAMGTGDFVSSSATGFTTCAPGFFRGLSSGPHCDACGNGTISSPWPLPTSCTACDEGQAPVGRLQCVDCGAGLYARRGGNACAQSPVGSFPTSAMDSGVLVTSRAAGFTLCPPGTFNPLPGGMTCSLCSVGSFAAAPGSSVCTSAPPGSFVDTVGSSTASQCPAKSYSDAGSFSCAFCPYPLSNSVPGSPGCPNVSINASMSELAAVLTVTLFVFALCIASAGRKMSIKIFLNVVFPALDVFSDLAYLLTGVYFSYSIFCLSVVAYSYGLPYFASHLMQHHVSPCLWIWPLERARWLGSSKSDDPIYFATFQGQRILSLDSHSNIFFVFVEVVIWLMAIAAQLLTYLLWPLVAGVYLAFLAMWFVLGAYLHMAKVLAIGRVWNLWIFVWRGWVTDEFSTDVTFDTEEHNHSLRNEFYFETAPQFFLQLTNNTLIQSWTPIAIFSAILSSIMAVNGIYRILYFTVLLEKPIPLFQVPTGNCMSVRMRFPFTLDLQIDFTIPSQKKDFRGRASRKFVHASIVRATLTQSPLRPSPPMDMTARAIFYRFFKSYVPLDVSSAQSHEEQLAHVDEHLDSAQYSGREEELIADVVGELYGTHLREIVPLTKRDSEADCIPSAKDNAARPSDWGDSRARKPSAFEMSNPLTVPPSKRLSFL